MNPDPLFEQFRREVEMHLPPLQRGGDASASGAEAASSGMQERLKAVRSLRSAARLIRCAPVAEVFAAWEKWLLARFEGGAQGHVPEDGGADPVVEALALVEEVARQDAASLDAWCTEHAEPFRRIQTRFASIPKAAPLGSQADAESDPSEPATGTKPPTHRTRSRRMAAKGCSSASTPQAQTAPPAPSRQTSTLTRTSMDELFRTEAARQVALMNAELVRLESGDDPAERTECLMRAAHSLKGAARIVNRPGLVHLAHGLEDCFVTAQQGGARVGAEETDCLLAVVDCLEAGTKVVGDAYAAWEAETERRRAALVDALDAIRRGTFDPARHAPPAAAMTQDTDAVVPSPTDASTDMSKVASTGAGATMAADASTRLATQSDLDASTETPTQSDLHTPAKTNAVTGAAVDTDVSIKEARRRRGSSHLGTDADEATVRVPAATITRLMGYAGEAVVQARSLQTLEHALRTLGDEQDRLLARLRSLRQGAASGAVPHVLAEAEASTRAVQQTLQSRLADLDAHVRRGGDLAERMHRDVLASRMRPFADGVRGFPRMVRDLARALGKPVDFTVMGEGVRVDRDVLEKLDAPLTHLLRNALDHGCQTRDERLAAGKTERNRVSLCARHWAGFLNITVEDDGGGIDLQRLRARIVERGLHDDATAAGLHEGEVLEFLFLPGFTTRDTVSELSGRGVGLDVVRALLQELGGGVRIRNRPGGGVAFDLRLPVTRSIVRVLLVEVAGETYAIPLNRIESVTTLADDDVHTLEGKPYLHIGGRNLPLLPASGLLGHDAAVLPPAPWSVVILHAGRRDYALQVDRLLDERELVVRPLDPRLGHVRDVDAVLMLEDGALVLLLDTDDLGESVDRMLGGDGGTRLARGAAEAAGEVPCRGRVLVVEDSETVRGMECAILRQAGYAVDAACNGAEGLALARETAYDAVVSDVDMPRMTGLEFVRALRTDPQRAATPVLILSYKDRGEDRRAAQEAGADAYLSKAGFDEAEFLAMIQGWTEGRR